MSKKTKTPIAPLGQEIPRKDALAVVPAPLPLPDQPIVAAFVPQPDITAHELALILPFLLRVPLFQKQWDDLGAATRHLQK